MIDERDLDLAIRLLESTTNDDAPDDPDVDGDTSENREAAELRARMTCAARAQAAYAIGLYLQARCDLATMRPGDITGKDS